VANLVQFLTQQRDAAKTQKTTAANNVAAANTDVAAKRAAATAAAAALNAKLQEIAAIRRDLAGIPTPGDGTALVAQLLTATLAAHGLQADLVRKTEAADTADGVKAQRGAELDGAGTRLAALEAALATATASEAVRNQLKAGATQTVRAAANDAFNNPPFTTAKTRIEADFPEKLRNRAVALADTELNQMAIAKSVRDRAKAKLNDSLGAAAKAQLVLDAADAALSGYVGGVAAQLQKALAAFTIIANPAQGTLSAAEKTAIADKAAARNDAADKEIKLSNAQAALDTAQEVVDDAGAGATQAQKDAVDHAKTDRDDAQNDVDQAVKDTLHDWEAAVPEANWQMFADWDAARRLLTWLRDTDPATLVTAANNAEDAVVTAVTAADSDSATIVAARAEAARAETLLAGIEKLRPVRTLSALRGDF
jgi:hypothetical protein